MVQVMRFWLSTAAAPWVGGVFEDFPEVDETGGPADQGGADEQNLGDVLEDGTDSARSALRLLCQVVRRGSHLLEPSRGRHSMCPLIPCHTWPSPIERLTLTESSRRRKERNAIGSA
jgi:hypothetical protein